MAEQMPIQEAAPCGGQVSSERRGCAAGAEPVTLIRASRGWGRLGLRDVWNHRELGFFLIWRDLKSRYRQMALGPLWILVKPLSAIVIFTVIFGKLANIRSEGLPYAVFSGAALLPWYFFTGGATASTASLSGSMSLISKVYFPRLIVPLVAVCSGLVDFVVSFVILAGLMAWYHMVPPVALLALPFYLLLAMGTALAVGLWLAGLAVRFRDVNFGLGYVLQAWLYASPVIYPTSLVQERWPGLYPIYRLNPMANVVEGFRWCLLGKGQGPDGYLLISAAMVVVAVVAGAYYFRRAERTIVDLH